MAGDLAGDVRRKKKNGFQVGPTNLPDGTYKRKVQKIKQNLIHKAKVKKQFARIKARQQNKATLHPSVHPDDNALPNSAASLEPHPERLALMRESPTKDENPNPVPIQVMHSGPARRRRTDPFAKQRLEALRRQEEADKKRAQREEAEEQRKKALAERARLDKLRMKARAPGRDGKRRLGKESIFLLEKAKKLMRDG